MPYHTAMCYTAAPAHGSACHRGKSTATFSDHIGFDTLLLRVLLYFLYLAAQTRHSAATSSDSDILLLRVLLSATQRLKHMAVHVIEAIALQLFQIPIGVNTLSKRVRLCATQRLYSSTRQCCNLPWLWRPIITCTAVRCIRLLLIPLGWTPYYYVYYTAAQTRDSAATSSDSDILLLHVLLCTI